MNKFILVVLLIITSGSASAEWVFGSKNDNGTHYYDPASLRKDGSKVKMWRLVDLDGIKRSGRDYKSTKTQDEYDCTEEQSRLIYLVLYSENMGSGQVVRSHEGDKNWEPVVPGSSGEQILKIACGKK